ncbi:MAG: glycosyltransferase family 4 protein [Cyclobacteriaceae bacterium]|nr:glycosyltransferase family 4 protein [Cyclobacteriaceae bacterium]
MSLDRNVLVLVPGQHARGGVTTYYKALRKHLPEKDIIYLERGARKFPYKKTLIKEVHRLTTDYLRFICVLMRKKIDIVHTNTSFDKSGVIRDSIYLALTKMFHKKTVVFYRGWDDQYADKLLAKQGWLSKKLLSADTTIVLAEKFKNDLIRAGYKGSVYVETTTVDIDLMDLKNLLPDRQKDAHFNILYLARLEKDKGIYIVLDSYKEIKKKHSNAQLYIGGDGQEYDNIKKLIQEQSLKDVTLYGFVSGKEKASLLADADLYIFPTNYKEGMPNSVLEAFAFGLPVITRPVAGLKDIFSEDNGFLIDSLDSAEYITAIESLINDKQLYERISAHNRKCARERFLSPVVAKRLLTIYANT